MISSCTVLIAAPELLPALKKRAADSPGELLTFADADALRALEMITTRRPALVVLERLFAATPRGAALINRIKADAALNESEIRVLSHDSDYMRVSQRRSADGGGAAAAGTLAPSTSPASSGNGPSAVPPAAGASGPGAAPTPPLDQRGTRRAPRFKIAPPLDVAVDGNQASLVDLSTVGAQIVSTNVLKPNQRIRLALTDDRGMFRFNAAVAWASFEIPPKGGPRYRAGIDFLDADPAAVDAYCSRHRG